MAKKFLAYRKRLSIPEDDVSSDADIWLFAEDLLNFVFRKHAGFPIIPTGEERRKCVHKGFTNAVKFAVELTQIKLAADIETVFKEMSKKDDVVAEYCKYVTDLRKVFRAGGFEGNECIHYCVLVAFLGEKFYKSGLRDFHYEAFAAVRRGFKKTDMANGGWIKLESAAEAIIASEEPVEKLRSASSPDVEQSPLDEEPIDIDIDSVIKDCLEDDCLSVSSVGSASSIAGAKALNSKGSVERLRLFNVSDDESEKVRSNDLFSKDLISPRKRPVKSTTTSSSTENLKFPKSKCNFLKSYPEKSAHATDVNFEMDNYHNEIIDFQDLSKHSDSFVSCSELRLNTPELSPELSPELLSPFDQVAKRNKTEFTKVDNRSENSSETGNSQKENEIPLDWSFSTPMEQVLKPNSESRRLPIFSELTTKVKDPNSAASTASASESPAFRRFKSF